MTMTGTTQQRQRRRRQLAILGTGTLATLTLLFVGTLCIILLVRAITNDGDGDEQAAMASNTADRGLLTESPSLFTDDGEDLEGSDFFDATPETTTTEPTTEYTETPTVSPTESPGVEEEYAAPQLKEEMCLPDRFDNTEMDVLDPEINIKRLYPGQFVCSKPYEEQRYRFGMTLDGNLIWQDTEADDLITLFDNDQNEDLYFELTTDATMMLRRQEDDASVWETYALNLKNRPMTHHKRCLYDHDCPYFHLHSDGVMVLNWIAGDDEGGWIARNFIRVYEFANGVDCGDVDAC